jgi:hypothetical protein
MRRIPCHTLQVSGCLAVVLVQCVLARLLAWVDGQD